MERQGIKREELLEIENLLKENNLPYEDILTSAVEFIISKSNDKVVGCIGIERYGEDGLLRSFAVENLYKYRGIGTHLLNELIKKSKNQGIKKLHLLTTTADKYFLKKGFKPSDRENVPTAIANSKEFAEICPSNSVYMTRILEK